MTVIWNTNIWAQERSILTLSGFSQGASYARLEITGHAELTALYRVPANGTLQIDLSDVVRMYTAGTWKITETTGATDISNVTRTWSRAGLINPRGVLIPETELTTNTAARLLISPPQVMLREIAQGNDAAIIFEAFGVDLQMFNTMRIRYEKLGTTEDLQRENKIPPEGETAFELWHLNDSRLARFELQELLCNHQYAAVEWTSLTGVRRVHTFEVVKQTSKTTDAVRLETFTGEYDERKGRRDGFTLKLEGLNRYDLWYYADLITSSFVRVSFDGVNWRQIQVTTDSYELPNSDEGELSTLEIAVNYKEYDTL